MNSLCARRPASVAAVAVVFAGSPAIMSSLGVPLFTAEAGPASEPDFERKDALVVAAVAVTAVVPEGRGLEGEGSGVLVSDDEGDGLEAVRGMRRSYSLREFM